MCEELNIESPDDDIPHGDRPEWLKELATSIVRKRMMPCDTHDSIHRSFIYCAFMYIDLRQSIRDEEGDQIICYWKHWLILFLGINRKNYALNLLCNLTSTFPRHIAYIVTHNRTVNTAGKCHHGKPLDQMLEQYNL